MLPTKSNPQTVNDPNLVLRARVRNWRELGLSDEPRIYWSKAAGKFRTDYADKRKRTNFYNKLLTAKRAVRRAQITKPGKHFVWDEF